MALPAVVAAAGLAAGGSLASGALNLFGNRAASRRQYRYNMNMMRAQNTFNKQMLEYQLDYDRPINQMARFKEAGLNPNLVYGQGTPGNMSSPIRSAQADVPDMGYERGMGTMLLSAAEAISRMQLVKSQADLNQVKVTESTVKQDLMDAQKNLVKANPYLKEEYVQALVTQLSAAANIKEMESRVLTGQKAPGNYTALDENNYSGTIMERKVLAEISNLEQRFKLQESDQRIKAEILQSKEFQNELQRIQVEWMKNGEITPQHIYQGIMLLLSKFMR